jgi:hypothetical protein
MGLLDGTTQQAYYQGNDHGNYQFTSLTDIINQFMAVYVGEDKIISKAKRLDVAFHAQRALAELSFDTFKSVKAQEITLPPSLQMTLPHDYVNYTKVSWVDSAGIKHLLYPASKTSNPNRPQVDSNNEFLFNAEGGMISSGNLIRNGIFHGGSDGWDLNVGSFSGAAQTTTLAAGTAADPITGSVGWFWDNNTVIAYNVPEYGAFKQLNVPIYSGEQYTITYTISGYASGEINFIITDEDGHYTASTNRSANGTYTETVTASGVLGDGTHSVQTLAFRSINATADLNATVDSVSIIRVGDDETSTTWSNYKSSTPSQNQSDDYQDDTYWPMDGSRYGLDPQHAQANGSFYIDDLSGKIHFSSNISGKTVILDYISDSLGTDGEMQVHKFAEEAMYKWISHAILAGRANVPEYQVNRFKKERFAAIRTAKLRLSNIKIEELTQILRGKSKWIKH